MANQQIDKIEDINEAINPITPQINGNEGLEILGYNRNQPVNLLRFSRSLFKIYQHLVKLYISTKNINDNKLDKGTYSGNAQNLKENIDSKEPKITRTDVPENNSKKVFSALGALNLKNWLVSNYTGLMNNIRETLDIKILSKLPHGGYGGTGQDLKNDINTKLDKTSIVNDLTTGGTNKVLSAEQGKNLDIYVKGKNTVKIKDDRERTPIPTDYESFNTTFTFNNNDGPFDGDWASVMTVKGWGEGYRPWQLAGHAGGYGPDFKGLWFREATAPNIWGSWAKIYTSS
ncbi:MAG: hypothetical protein MJH09_10420, partial [Cetobacterium sp.]|nr:hypothetical protein [Cetobacterium sp.]